MQDRLLTALGALAAAVAVVAGFALLFSVLDDGGSGATPSTTVIVRVPGGQTSGGDQAKPGHASVGTKATRSATSRPARVPTLAARPPKGVAFAIAHVREGARVDLHSAPGGQVLAKLGDATEFGSPVSFSVVATKPGWLGVSAPELPNGELGWIARDPTQVDVYWTRYSLHASLPGRSLELRYGHKVVGRFPVTVGGPGTETPPGRYGVTDGVSFDESPYYGCCALALSGHQYAELPAGWIGGNRLAIHGTPGSVGGAESLGCIRATDETMHYLFARVPLGTPVFIDA
ncbi:MAG TPA: L,D-transpeptidase [Solirubrobacterales bacterium]|nr:L,D-transpeptidase [Solirubrobacterales bacterium]